MAQGGVEPGDRLVQEEVAGARREGARQGEALGLAAGDLVGAAAPALAGQVEGLQERLGDGLVPVGAARRPEGAEGTGDLGDDVVARVEAGGRVLGHVLDGAAVGAQRACAGASAAGDDGAAVEQDGSGVGGPGGVEEEERLEEGGLAAAGAAQEGDALGGLQAQVDVVQDGVAPARVVGVGAPQPGDPEAGCGHARASAGAMGRAILPTG